MTISVGFLTNAEAVTGITVYALAKVIALTDTGGATDGITTTPGSETELPQGVYLDHIEVRATNTGAVTSMTCWLSWDAAGDQPATAEGTIQVVTGITTTTLIGGAVAIDAWARPPGKTLTLYLWIKPNANTIAIAAGGVRLHWTDGFSR